jgi:hypothetical protein
VLLEDGVEAVSAETVQAAMAMATPALVTVVKVAAVDLRQFDELCGDMEVES